jgi:NAD(P)-dependent dehydrogenase (short-subunit alcohol dehydrogenase family)
MKLQNKVAIITGASQGFGLAVAKSFVKEGAKVAICGRDLTSLELARKELIQLAGDSSKVLALKADIVNQQEVLKLMESTYSQFGKIDILVANAGIYGPKGSIDTVDWNAWCDAIDINLKGTVFSCRAALPFLKKASHSKIIILSGGGATKPLPNLSAYAASKAAVVRFAETLSEELKEVQIEVNTVAPGALNTRLLDEVLEAGEEIVGKDFYQRSLKQKQQGGDDLEKGAALCVYLASSQSDNLTGKLISAVWDKWEDFASHIDELKTSDAYTLRRITGRDRGFTWGDK